MSVLSDTDLRINHVLDKDIITPFSREIVREKEGNKIISYGCSSYGYDIRCSNEFKIFNYCKDGVIDPKNFSEDSFTSIASDTHIIIPSNSFALAVSMETFNIPRDVIGVCYGKSTYARCGVVVNVTPLEPEWTGELTIELSNTSPRPVKIYANEGIAQIVFFRSDNSCLVSYKDRAGKYNGQKGITLPKL